jgi:hypothetical protein
MRNDSIQWRLASTLHPPGKRLLKLHLASLPVRGANELGFQSMPLSSIHWSTSYLYFGLLEDPNDQFTPTLLLGYTPPQGQVWKQVAYSHKAAIHALPSCFPPMQVWRSRRMSPLRSFPNVPGSRPSCWAFGLGFEAKPRNCQSNGFVAKPPTSHADFSRQLLPRTGSMSTTSSSSLLGGHSV